MRNCKKCQNDTFGVREKCHFFIQREESEKNKAKDITNRADNGINY